MRSNLRILAAGTLLAVGLSAGLSGCASSFPADPDGTLDRVSGGTLRVGIAPNGDWTDMTDDGEASGIEVSLIEDFAETIDADIAWVEGSEEALFTRLEDGGLDLVIGGFTDRTPWLDRAAITKPFTEVSTSDGVEKHVMAASRGENAFLLELERFLLATEGAP
ncbi:ABC-type amino acid transport substrate-binding protein [Mycetocola sp. CAN_C7]|uniref:transporter substrate-binding domain-containing protein n=1 Tax=Mycetocola sp. CAN_C7 TaxID=2787724 RepID=UPI0018CAD77A